MFTQDEKIILTIFLSTLMIMLFGIVVIIAILKYRKKQRDYANREIAIKNELVKAVLEAKEEILEDISDQVHVDIQQTLSLTKISLNRVLLQCDSVTKLKFAPIKELVNQSIDEVKSLSRSFDPKMITGHTLEDNIIRILNRINKRSGINTKFNASKYEISITDEQQILMYRIVQEAINNIISHSGATKIIVDLVNLKDDFLLRIRDNGKGFVTPKVLAGEKIKFKGSGITSIQQRIQLLNGSIIINSKLNYGTEIIMHIPYDKDN